MSYVGGVSIAGTTHPVAHSLFGICTTEATEAEKVITCPSFDHLATGVSINVLFMRGNGNLHPTANVNGTGALPLVAWVADEQAEPSEGDGDGEGGGSTDTLVAWHAGSVLTLTYDGTHWVAHGGGTAGGGGGEQDLSPIYDQIDVLFAAVDSARDDTNAVMEALDDYALDADLDTTNNQVLALLDRILFGETTADEPYAIIRADNAGTAMIYMTEDHVSLRSDGIEVLDVSDGAITIPHSKVSDEMVGDWLWRQRGNGHLTLTYEGSGS